MDYKRLTKNLICELRNARGLIEELQDLLGSATSGLAFQRWSLGRDILRAEKELREAKERCQELESELARARREAGRTRLGG